MNHVFSKSILTIAALGAVSLFAEELADRVAADFASAPKAEFRHYAVPAMSTVQRLPDTYPCDGVPGAPVRIIAAKGEYEPGSFVVWGENDLGKVQFEVGELKTADGKIFPASGLDLKFVKCWYQNGNAWFSYFGDTGFKLVPELLVNDEDLIRTDHEKKANYARLQEEDGTEHEQWINPPRQFDQKFVNVNYRKSSGFQSMRPNFHDAKTLKPVSIPKGEFRQFILTVHVGNEIPAGIYNGQVTVKGEGEELLGAIPVELKVCDFELPYPRTYAHPEKEFLVSSYAYISYGYAMEYNGGDRELAKKQLFEVFRDMASHNQPMYIIQWGNEISREKVEILEMMQRAGMSTDFITGLVSPIRNGAVPHEQLDAQARDIVQKLETLVGHHNLYMTFGDEPGWKWIYPSREIFPIYQKYGIKFYIAGSESVFHRNGYLYDWHNFNDTPESARSAALLKNWQPITDTYVGWYANHHVGTEDPAFNRRQNGLAAYLAGYSALCNYAHHFGPYNDDSTGYKPMVFAYGTGDGVLDTLQWEGFREGIDDIRYATLMCSLARSAKKAYDIETRYLGGKALQFLGEQDGATLDMDAVRCEMVRYIEALLAKGVKPETYPSMKPSKRITKESMDAVFGEPPDDDARELFLSFAYGNVDFARAEGPARRILAKDINGANPDLVTALIVAEPELIKGNLDELLIGKGRTNNAVNYVVGRLTSENHIFLYQRKFDAWKNLYMWAKTKMPDVEFKPSFELAKRAAYCYGITGDREGMKREIEWAIAANNTYKPEDVFALKAFIAVSEAKQKPTSSGGRRTAVRQALESLEKECARGVESKTLADALCVCGPLFSELGDEDALRGLDDYRHSLIVAKPKKTYTVKFSDIEIGGRSGWDKLDFVPEKAVFDRNYGTSKDFLATDVTTGRRVSKIDGEKLDEMPYMEVVADVRGLHFRYTVSNTNALVQTVDKSYGASFEGYIAPGENEPYICITMEPGIENRLAFCYNTSYDTFGHRRMKTTDLDRYRLDTDFTDKAVIYTLSFDWENWAEKIPKNGSAYDYEQMIWTRAGNFAWNGTESIHGRSTWGHLKFEITDAQRAKILRPILARAWAFYLGEKRECGDGYEGALAHWSDPETGDTLFYATEIVPLMSRLDVLGAELTPNSDDKTILKLAKEALPLWRNIRLEVERRRGEYLKRTLCASAPKPESLFNGKDLSGWYVKLNGQARGSDTNNVFSVSTNGSLLVSGEGAGYIATENEYSDYHLSLEYRFCGKGWYHKEQSPADSGLLFHGFGPDGAVDGGTWMASYECDIIVGRTGDLIVVGDDNVKEPMSCLMNLSGDQFNPRTGRLGDVGKFKVVKNRWAPRKSDPTDKRPTAWPEHDYGEWNRLELVTLGDTATFILNGQVVNVAECLPIAKGKILLKSELHGVEFRNIEITR